MPEGWCHAGDDGPEQDQGARQCASPVSKDGSPGT